MKLLRFYSNPNELGIRAAVLGELNENKLTITIARCSANDQFNKAKARIITEGRLAKSKIYQTIDLNKEWSMKEWIPIASKIADEVCNVKYPHKKYNKQFN